MKPRGNRPLRSVGVYKTWQSLLPGAEVQNPLPLAGSLAWLSARSGHHPSRLSTSSSSLTHTSRPDQHQLPFCLSLSLLTISRCSPPSSFTSSSAAASLAARTFAERKREKKGTPPEPNPTPPPKTHKSRGTSDQVGRSSARRRTPATAPSRPGARKVREPLPSRSPLPFLCPPSLLSLSLTLSRASS